MLHTTLSKNRLTAYGSAAAVLLFVGSLLPACGPEIPDEVAAQMEKLPTEIDYNFHVKPILSDRCFACHGPDAETQKADLRLDTEAGAKAALTSGEGHAIVSGSLANSQLVHRVLSDDPDVMMPPPESNLALNDYEVALLTRWVEQGAEYKPHWAFTKPEPQPVPDLASDWAINEIDRFVAAKLEEQDITPAEPARRELLIRRLYFDLTGLPPSVADIRRILEDTRPDYYERLVDSLLALPAYGERMATHWLDVARFADSEGYLDDFHHEMWPYRDWVIEAYNKNLPYNDFILWQVGGDQIPGATDEQRLATAFNRTHKQNSEGGIIPEEFRVEYVADRTNTLGTAFLGLTVGCARCHDHKYDPISQKNYFQFFSFFNNTVERGDAIFAFNAIENGNDVPNELSMNAGPVMALPSEEVAEVRKFLLQKIDRKERALQQTADDNRPEAEQWMAGAPTAKTLEKVVDEATMLHLTFDDAADGVTQDLAQGSKAATYRGLTTAPGQTGLAIECGNQGQLVADGSRVSFERMEPFTVSFWIKAPQEYDEAHVIYNGNNRIQGYRGWDVILDSTRLSFRLNHAHPYQSLDVRIPKKLPLNEWHHFVWTYDGSSQAEGMTVYHNGQQTPVDILRNHLYRSTKPYTDDRATVYMPYQGLIIGNRHYDQDFSGGMLDGVRILNKESGALVARYLYNEAEGKKAFEEAVTTASDQALAFYNLHLDKGLAQQRRELQAIQQQEIATIDTVQEIMVMGDRERKRPTYVLERGVYDAHGEVVTPDVPNDILPWPEGLPRNRYGLGKWLIHEDHPLTARVAVNQFWYLMFGRGLVETVEDFGNQGALPTHPELLDWLAIDFRENGWDVKRLVRQLVTSATYRQSSVVRPELQEIDPNNLLLARGTRYRRSAEMIRDNILVASRLLDPTVGGASVFPYQPAGLWGEIAGHAFLPEYEVDTQKGLYRRSLYTFWKRNMPPPSMLVFDAASRGECQVRRQRSNTPLQALVLLNDPQMIEACRALSERVWQETPEEISTATRQLFMTLIGREPTEREQAIMARQFADEVAYFSEQPEAARQFLAIGHRKMSPDLPVLEVAALARVANTVMNTTEGYYKN